MGLGTILKIGYVIVVCLALLSAVKELPYLFYTGVVLFVILIFVYAFNRKKLHP